MNNDRFARNKLIEHNLRLVAKIILEDYKNLNDDIKSELFSVGCVALCSSIKTFIPSYKNKFSTYATSIISGKIKVYIRDNSTIHVPRSLKHLYLEIKKLKYNNKKLSIKDLSNILNVSEFDIIEAINAHQNISSIYFPIYMDNEKTKHSLDEILPDYNSTVEKNIEEREKKKDLMDAIDSLTEKERTVILSYFGINCNKLNQYEIAEILNISQAEVSRKLKKALIKLKKLLPEYLKEDYRPNLTYSNKKEKNIAKTIYSFFYLYTKEDIDNALDEFSDEEKQLILLKLPFSEKDFNPKSIVMYCEQNNLVYSQIYQKINKLIKNLNKKLVNKNFVSNNKVKKYK